jgi:uncharacterized protein YgiM (DUF1202 family)
MMKNNKTIWWIVGGVAVLGAGYLILRKFTKKGEKKSEEIRQSGAEEPVELNPPTPPVLTGNPLLDIGNTISNFLSNYQDYVVSTQTSSLNLRSNPDGASKVVGSLKKGSIVRAKASGVKGWFAVSDNDKDIKGYVSSTFLKAKK